MEKLESYIGVKIVKAVPMTKNSFDYEKHGRNASDLEENPDGYKVIYPDGYESWSPKEVFDNCYRLVSDEEKELVSK